jgi:hypothetical protein
MANEKKSTWMFGHCCIINELCKNAGVVIDSSDVDLIPKAVIDHGWMDKCRDTPVDDSKLVMTEGGRGGDNNMSWRV